MNSFAELGPWKTNCVSKVKVFKKAVNNVQKENLKMHMKSIISLCSQHAAVMRNYPSPYLWAEIFLNQGT